MTSTSDVSRGGLASVLFTTGEAPVLAMDHPSSVRTQVTCEVLILENKQVVLRFSLGEKLKRALVM